jgi:calcium binding protein 39
MPCGVILREALKYDVITAVVLYDQSNEGEPAVRLSELKPSVLQGGNGVFWNFFEWIDKGNFEVSADAFTTFRVGLSSALFPATWFANSSATGDLNAS